MTDKELELIIRKSGGLIKKKQPLADTASIDDAIMDSVAKYLEMNGSLDKLTIGWLVLAGSRKLIDSYRRQHKNVSLEELFNVELVPDEHVGLSDLKLDNEDLSEYADNLLFPWLNDTEEKSDEAA